MNKYKSFSKMLLLAVMLGSFAAVSASAVAGEGPMPVSLGEAGTFAILSKSGITDVYRSRIVGDVGTSPITGAALLLTCKEVSGTIYTVDAAGPLPCAVEDATFLTAAVGDMGFAYDDAAGRLFPDYSELGAGEIGGLTLAPGLYKWSTGLLISTDVTLSGGPDDVWIFQVAGTMNQANATRVTLAGGALSKNIFWQVAGAVTLGTNAHFEGIVLGKTMIAVNTGTSVNGRLFAQTAVTLQMNAITEPAESVAEQIDVPQYGLFVDTGNTPVDLNAEIYYGVYVDTGATLNLLADAIVHYMNAYDGSFVNIYGGIADDFGIAVFDGATVTVYGTGFIVYDGTIDPSGDFFTVDGIGTLEVTYSDGATVSLLVFSSDVPIYLVDTSGGDPIEVQIDIKPNEQNNINLKSKGVVPVAVLTTDDFDAATVDPATVQFAGAAPVRWKFEDVDDDGDDDMMFHFRTQDLDLDQDSTEATLTAELLTEVMVSGTDEVRIVPSNKK